MGIISAYVREDWLYTAAHLKSKSMFSFEGDEDGFIRFLKDLLARKVIKLKSKSDNDIDEEEEIDFNNYNDKTYLNAAYKFEFVGIAICRNRLIYAYPKYIGVSNKLPPNNPQREFTQVLRVIEKYSREKSKQDIYNIDLFADEGNRNRDKLLSVILFLLEDYASNGAYETDDTLIEINGSDNILWQKTIDETYPILSYDRPYYIELYTRRNVNNDYDYLKRLHEFVVTRCSQEIEKASLTDFFSLPSICVSDEDESAFGDEEQILNIIENTISQTFDDRKLSVLIALKVYFNSGKVLLGENELQLIGTRSFKTIWEEVCAKVFTSQKNNSLNKIAPYIDHSMINKNFKGKTPTLVELIKQPIWKRYCKGAKGVPKDTLNPDYLRFERTADMENYVFYILDAKYYCPDWKDDSISGQPGVEDISKQYLYYLAYRDVLEKYKVNEVRNYFLMPKRDGEDKIPGFAKMDILKQLGLGVVEVRMLEPQLVYDNYLRNQRLNLSELQ